MRIYIESTIPSYLVARPARDLLQAARQQITCDWWELKRQQHELFTSQIAVDEVRRGELAMAQAREAILAGIPLLLLSEQSKALARRITESGVSPAQADRDVAQIALATWYRMDALLSWNLRHIANFPVRSKLRRVVDGRGSHCQSYALLRS